MLYQAQQTLPTQRIRPADGGSHSSPQGPAITKVAAHQIRQIQSVLLHPLPAHHHPRGLVPRTELQALNSQPHNRKHPPALRCSQPPVLQIPLSKLEMYYSSHSDAKRYKIFSVAAMPIIAGSWLLYPAAIGIHTGVFLALNSVMGAIEYFVRSRENKDD